MSARRMGPHGPYYPDEIQAVWEQTRRSVAEYQAHPHVGNFSGYRAPCTSCATPTYSKHGVCRACQSKGDS